MQTSAIKCPDCESVLRLPLKPQEQNCPICAAPLPLGVRQAASAAASAAATDFARGPHAPQAPTAPLPRPPLTPSIPLGGAPPPVIHVAWPPAALASPAVAPPLIAPTPRSMPTPTPTPWQGSPAPGPTPRAPAGFVTAGMLGPVEGSYKREKSGATPWAVFMGLTSLALFIGSGSLGAPAAIIGALTLLLCLILSVSAASSSRATLALHQGGLELTQGSSTELYRFDDVTSVWHAGPSAGGSKEPARAPFTIEFSDKRRLTLKANAYADSARLANALAAKLGQSLLVRELKEIRAGRPVTFGPVRVDNATISNGSQTLPWAVVDGVRAHAGAIEISQQGRWTRWAPVTPLTANTLALPGIASAIRGLPPPP